MKSQLQIAEEIARVCHAGQVDKGGVEYIQHPLKVSAMCNTEQAKVVALLHDTIEDCGETVQSLIDKGIAPDTAEIVGLMTHKASDTYMQYIDKIKTNPIAVEVKLADLTHNSDISRIPHPMPWDYKRLDRYAEALWRLKH